jgi:hypothetical protein
MLSVVTDAQGHDELRLDLDAIVREGARRMLAAALEAEVDDHLAAHAAERDEHGRASPAWRALRRPPRRRQPRSETSIVAGYSRDSQEGPLRPRWLSSAMLACPASSSS